MWFLRDKVKTIKSSKVKPKFKTSKKWTEELKGTHKNRMKEFSTKKKGLKKK